MAFHNRAVTTGMIRAAVLAAISAGALMVSEPAFAFHGGGGWHGGGGGWHGGGWGRPGWGGGGAWGRPGWGRPGWGGGWGRPGWGAPGWGWGGVAVAPAFGWGWGAPGWGWGGDYYAQPVYSECFYRRVQVQTRYGWRWRRVRYCYQ
jgi:hypothetical protein